MTETLRALQRQADTSGTTADAARALAERLRRDEECGRCKGRSVFERRMFGDDQAIDPCPSCAGLTLQERVELAAYVGDEAARLVVPVRECQCQCLAADDEPGARCNRCDFDVWAYGISRWGQATCVRAAVAAGWVALEKWCEGRLYEPAVAQVVCAIEAAESWLDCPCEEHLPALATWSESNPDTPIPEEDRWWRQLRVICNAIQVPGRTALAIGSAARLTSEATVRTAIRGALVPWALG